MYARTSAFAHSKSLGAILKVCKTIAPELPRALAARNFGTATEMSEFHNNVDASAADSHGCGNYNNECRDWGTESMGYRNSFENRLGDKEGRVYGRSLGGTVQNQNMNRFEDVDVQHAGNFVSTGLGNDINQKGADFNGYCNERTLRMRPNSSVQFDAQNNFDASYRGSGNEEMFRHSGYNAGTHMQNGSGIHYSNNAWNHQQSWNETWRDGVTCSQLPSDMRSNVEAVKGPERSPQSKLEELDELTKEGKLKEAVQLLRQVQDDGVKVELPQYTALMKACGDKQALDEAKFVHEYLLKSIPHLEVRTFNEILDMYSSCGSMEDAFTVFDRMLNRNMTSWDIMISGLAKNGLGEAAIDLFTEFKKSGLEPDAQMFIGVFAACGVVCDIVEGMLHFESMTKDYGIVPTMEHYVSIVDMIGKSGGMNEALEFIEKMPVKPSVDVWETLMKSCRIHGNMELGDQCAGLIELLEPSRLDEQSRVGLIPIKASDIEKEKEKRKLSGQNLLDVRSRVHEYRAGDRSHPDHERIYELLWGLKQQMKEVGYVPETKFVLHDVDQEVKEEALMAHSERLAAAQGFLTSAARSSMRIIKNLRVCGDCHNAFKIISKIVGREIIARDSKRFHHFKDGSCSCNDYW